MRALIEFIPGPSRVADRLKGMGHFFGFSSVLSERLP
jgi:hypothetical protein